MVSAPRSMALACRAVGHETQPMLLHAVIVPPRTVLDEVVQVVRSVDEPRPPSPPQPSSGSSRRRRDRGVPEAGPPAPTEPGLDLVPPEQLHLPITGFGNVTAGDASRLAATLTEAAAGWARPTVRITGGGALEFPDDRAVWAKLEGDVDGLVSIARGVVQAVQSRGFFVDRRAFRPWLAVATITDATTAPYLEEVVAALDAFRGEPWAVECVSVMKRSFSGAVPGSMESYRIPLAPA
jgi:2'-5' RNA ligase